MKYLKEKIAQLKEIIAILLENPCFWLFVGFLVGLTFIVKVALFYHFWISAPEFLDYNYMEQKSHELHSGVMRNRGWLFWMILSFTGLLAGLYLTYWGRQIQERQWEIQRESHLHERLEKATAMQGNETMAVRITACRLLMSLAIDEESMKILCVHLLFAFINNPYLKPDEQDKDPNDLFSDKNKPLRADIQEAADSFSNIYEHYGDRGIDNKPVNLPIYFWKNQHKSKIFLAQADLSHFKNMKEADLRYANLQGAYLTNSDLQEANLSHANLQGAYLDFAKLQAAQLILANLGGAILFLANLEGANLSHAKLWRANLSDTNLQGVNFDGANLEEANLLRADISGANMNSLGLSREQILSAKWGIDDGGENNPPVLTEELECDSEVQKWLAKPHYNKRKKTS